MIFLDIDNTLIDHSTAERIGAQCFGAEFASEIPEYAGSCFVKRWHDAAERHIADFLSGAIPFQEQRRRRLRDVFRDPYMSDHRADQLFNMYLEFYQDSWCLFPDVLPFLESHKSIGFAVISDGAQEQQVKKLESQGIDTYMRFVITAESTGLCKPDPRMFHKACRLGKVAPASVCYIGDNLTKDAMGASDAGLRGIWLNRSGSAVPEGVESITSLKVF